MNQAVRCAESMIAFGTDVLQIGVCLILESWKDILSVGMVKLESSPIFHTVVCTSRPKELITINGWVPTFWWTNGLISGGENITTQGRYGRCECTRLCGICIQPGTVLVCVWHEIAVHLSVNEASQMIIQKSHCCTITQLKISGL